MGKKSSIIHKTAILVFAASGGEDSRTKSIVNGEELFFNFTQQTLQTVKKTGLSYYHFGEKEQKGKNFGERFVNAIQSVFDLGFEYIIAVGNDSPKLRSKHISQTLVMLQENKAVLGPNTDGGFYLMGIRETDFIPGEFLNLPWQSSKILQAVKQLMSGKGLKTRLLERLMDIDNLEDLQLFIRRHNNIPYSILTYSKYFLHHKNRFFDLIKKVYLSYCTSIFYNKGSPITSFGL